MPGNDSYYSFGSDDDSMSSDGEQELPSCHILPYQFEPLDHRENEVAQDSTPCEITKRVGNTDWCLCGHCKPMTSEAKSVCCIEEISGTFFNTRCISRSDNFGQFASMLKS